MSDFAEACGSDSESDFLLFESEQQGVSDGVYVVSLYRVVGDCNTLRHNHHKNPHRMDRHNHHKNRYNCCRKFLPMRLCDGCLGGQVLWSLTPWFQSLFVLYHSQKITRLHKLLQNHRQSRMHFRIRAHEKSPFC